jgi:hypothetical protein
MQKRKNSVAVATLFSIIWLSMSLLNENLFAIDNVDACCCI